MRKLLFVTAILALAAPVALAQQTDDTHEVTVTVNSMDNIDVQNDVALTVVFDPVTGLGSATDNSAVLYWVTNQANRKITVESDIAARNYPLFVEPAGIVATVGAAPGGYVGPVGGVDLDVGVVADFVDSITQSGGQTNLVYTATATIASPTGTDTHNVTYSILSM